jgi:pre-rRNA-processing protein IPI3
VTALALSMTGTLLLAGTTRGQVHVFDVSSHQLLRTFAPAGAAAAAAGGAGPTMAVTFLRAGLRPPDLIGHVSLGGAAGGTARGTLELAPRTVVPFQRTRDARTREKHEVWMALPPAPLSVRRPGACRDVHGNADRHVQSAPLEYTEDELLRDRTAFLGGAPVLVASAGAGAAAGGPVVLQGRVNELEAEVARLRAQLGRAKGVNDAMWGVVVKKVAGVETETGSSMDAVGDGDERRRKQSRRG